MKVSFACALAIAGILAATPVSAAPPSREEGERREKRIAELKASLALEATDAARFALLAKAVRDEPDPDTRRMILKTAPAAPGTSLDAFLIGIMTDDPDAGLRGLAALTLGKSGSETSLPALAATAANDRTSDARMGCMVGRSSARRSATFALAEVAGRFPKVADDAADKLRALKPPVDPKDSESLADARVQALFRITRDPKLIEPFFARIESDDVRTRENGIVAFRFLKLTTAPAPLIAALKDESEGVRSWAILVLGEIRDPKTVPLFVALASDPKQPAGLRCGAIDSLGRMKVATATDPMRKLLADESVAVQTSAAIALYRLTGEKAKQFPKGYDAD